MRSLPNIKTFFVLAWAATLAGCLVSEDPILDASNGHATPVDPGAYIMCPLSEDADDDCDSFVIEYDASGLYRFLKEGEEPTEMRFRRIGRQGYAVQSHEDDGYAYYYGAGDSDRFRLTMMMCADLPEKTRARLIERGDLATEDGDFEMCSVNSLKGLTDAARAYHRGQSIGEEVVAFEFMPAPDSADAGE
jgi:hypothetical protein